MAGIPPASTSSSTASSPSSVGDGADAPRSIGAAWARSRKRLLIALCALTSIAWAVDVARDWASEGTRDASLVRALARRGVRVEADSIAWFDERTSWGTTPVLFLASDGQGPADVVAADVRLGPAGAVIDVGAVANLTRSGGAAEEQLRCAGDFAGFVTRTARGIEAVTIVDGRGEPEVLTRDWSAIQRIQNAISNWQETGRWGGLGVTRFELLEPVESLTLALEGGHAVATSEARRLVIALDTLEVVEGASLVEVRRQEKGVPGGITWVVDTVRNLSFVGPEPIEWLENRVFAWKDWWERTRYAWFGGGDETAIAAEAAAEMATTAEPTETEERRILLDAAAAEIGFPPSPIRGVFAEPLEGEGAWVPIVDDPFVNAYPNAPAAFAQTFVRPDRERPYVTVFVTLWDPRQVRLRIMSGTREPESATGQRGTGYIPRDERTARFLVGAFNGGFQAMHGEFGMMTDGRVYLPPKPWAATVAVMDDGRVGMGSWPAPDWRGRYYDENLANRQIPGAMVDLRQNLTSVVEDGVFNPWERWWWGAAPPGASEQTYTHRSGLCLTQEGFMAFFWGGSLGPEALGQAMISARCVRAMHLDMNSGHCGFEFFRPYRTVPDPSQRLPPPVASLHPEAEFDGPFPGVPGMRIRARKAVRSMQMRFPRYTARDPRDFFYLTLVPTLPGPALSDGTEFSTAGLPHAGWPYAFARARHGDAWLVRIDPSRAVPEPIARERHRRILARLASSDGTHALVARRQTVGWRFAIEPVGAAGIELVRGGLATSSSEAVLGVDRDGFVVYAEGPGALAALDAASVDVALDLVRPTLVLETGEGGAGPDGRPRAADSRGVAFLAEEAPATEVLWPENRPRPYAEWGYLQGQRVRYFPSGPPRFVRPTE